MYGYVARRSVNHNLLNFSFGVTCNRYLVNSEEIIVKAANVIKDDEENLLRDSKNAIRLKV